MRTPRPALVLFLCVLIPRSVTAQTGVPVPPPPTPSPLPQPNAQATALIQSALAVLTGGLSPSDVTMTGSITTAKSGILASITNGLGQPTGKSGTITFVATAAGQGQNTTATTSGTSVSIQDISQSTPSLTVTANDGAAHTIQTASALTPHPGWFYPAFVLASGLSSSYAASYVGRETWQGVVVEHIAIWRVGASGTATPLLQTASQHDIYLDSTSLLPVGMTFVMHAYDPDSPGRPIIPYRGNSPDRLMTVRFSDYQQVQGKPVAFHIQSTMTIVLTDEMGDFTTDIHISSVSFNTGATITVPTTTAN